MPLPEQPALSKLVPHAFMILHTRDRTRIAWQRVQMRHFGMNVTLVLGYDAEELRSSHLACLFPPPARFTNRSDAAGAPPPKYASQLIKLWSAAYRMLILGLPRVFLFEDDVVVRFSWMWLIDAAVETLNRLKQGN